MITSLSVLSRAVVGGSGPHDPGCRRGPWGLGVWSRCCHRAGVPAPASAFDAGAARCTALARASTLAAMEQRAQWLARAWLPYFLAGVVWVTVGALVLGDPNGLGLIFIGMACLALGVCGAGWRLRHGYGLVRSQR